MFFLFEIKLKKGLVIKSVYQHIVKLSCTAGKGTWPWGPDCHLFIVFFVWNSQEPSHQMVYWQQWSRDCVTFWRNRELDLHPCLCPKHCSVAGHKNKENTFVRSRPKQLPCCYKMWTLHGIKWSCSSFHLGMVVLGLKLRISWYICFVPLNKRAGSPLLMFVGLKTYMFNRESDESYNYFAFCTDH